MATVILSQIFFFFPKGRLFGNGTGGTALKGTRTTITSPSLRGGSGDADKQDRFGIINLFHK